MYSRFVKSKMWWRFFLCVVLLGFGACLIGGGLFLGAL
ncbi:uncharacterized protein MP3633_1327 [Marinomonas primoryensis]|uniref:Uncharacterized protein n=1 Tax=Marinomonas primoryensis TaxID=178399 RepID=A0A859D040_9GAMM|nr:uncharacterized protein MP3633_1327 [Marinomonas primoryensis]